MRFDVPPEELRQARVPHELFLVNLIGNHILLTVVLGGLAGSYPWAMAAIPLISFAILGLTLWRARRARGRDPWFVMCHWQVGARRSLIFMAMLALLLVVLLLGWAGQVHAGLMKEAVWALVAGIGILPVMATLLVLVILESDTLHRAGQGRVPAWAAARFPDGRPPALAEDGA